MAYRYREHRPSARLSPYVECFWSFDAGAGGPHRILPDGCMDAVFSIREGLRLTGVMTRHQTCLLEPSEREFGVRFRPGMAYLFTLEAPPELTDQTIELRGMVPPQRLAETLHSPTATWEVLERFLIPKRTPAPVDALWPIIAAKHGLVDLDELATQAGLSTRQFRRVCAARTGLSPKHLCRVLRFRRASSLLPRIRQGALGALAADCGYADQAHFIHEFREFSGLTPLAYAAALRMSDSYNPAQSG